MRGTVADRVRENAAFLKALRRTANVTLAAEAAGQTRKTFQKRRARNPDFATEWDAALAFAQAQLAAGPGAVAARGAGGDYGVRGSRGRRVQVRRLPPGTLTPEAVRRFLSHLAATANVRLSAQATGVHWSTVYALRRRSATFAREMADALAEGYERLELALLACAEASLCPDGSAIADWRDGGEGGEPAGPLARMSPKDALLLLGYRRKNIVEGVPHAGFAVPRSTREEAEGWLGRKLDAVERRLAREAAGEGGHCQARGGDAMEGRGRVP
ncbi:hypothetical protein ACX40Y_14500 [Sphingomonas sp. RS6]